MNWCECVWVTTAIVCLLSMVPALIVSMTLLQKTATYEIQTDKGNETVLVTSPSPTWVDAIHVTEYLVTDCFALVHHDNETETLRQHCRETKTMQILHWPLELDETLPYHFLFMTPIVKPQRPIQRFDVHFDIRWEVLISVLLAMYAGILLTVWAILKCIGSRYSDCLFRDDVSNSSFEYQRVPGPQRRRNVQQVQQD